MEYYLKFTVGDISFAAPIDEVTEIVRPRDVEIASKGAKNLMGHFNLRGDRVPIFDLPFFLEIGQTGSFEIIVSRIDRIAVGFKVNRVFGIVSVESQLPYPDIVKAKDFMPGVISDQDSFLQVLSFRKILSGTRGAVFKKTQSPSQS